MYGIEKAACLYIPSKMAGLGLLDALSGLPKAGSGLLEVLSEALSVLLEAWSGLMMLN